MPPGEMEYEVYYNGIHFGRVTHVRKNKSRYRRGSFSRGRYAHEVNLVRGNYMIRGYFASIEGGPPDLFVGVIAHGNAPGEPRVYRVVCDDALTILDIHRDATAMDFAHARHGRPCLGVISNTKNTDLLNVINGVRITVIH